MLIAECGAHPTTRQPSLPAVILKVGTFDDPGLLGGPRMAIYMFVDVVSKGHGIGVRTCPAHEMAHQIQRNAPVWPMATGCGSQVRLQADSVGSVA
jgi:hypothetical protein